MAVCKMRNGTERDNFFNKTFCMGSTCVLKITKGLLMTTLTYDLGFKVIQRSTCPISVARYTGKVSTAGYMYVVWYKWGNHLDKQNELLTFFQGQPSLVIVK